MTEKHTIGTGITKRGYGLHQFFNDEYNQISIKMGIGDYENKSPSEWKNDFLKALGVTPHSRPTMTQEERTNKAITKLALSLGVSNEKLAQAKQLLGL